MQRAIPLFEKPIGKEKLTMKKQEVGGVPGNVLGMFADLALKLQHEVITPEQFGKFLKKQNPFGEIGNNLTADWEAFYRNLGINCDLSGVRIPDDPGGFGRVIIMAQGVTAQSAYDLCAKNFPCWKYTDKNLDEVVNSERNAKNGPYAIRVRDRVEADEELKNCSYNDLKRDGVVGITLEEREIFELKFFKETGKHLDIDSWTLCAGSLGSDGRVPGAGWGDFGFEVGWIFRDDSRDNLRSRVEVS